MRHHALTDLPGRVAFDFNGNGVPEWVAWLAVDLDGDGTIRRGQELFAGPPSGPIRGRAPTDLENSFTLLAAYDDPANGGDGDGVISAADAVFGRLRLWVDANHDGISQPEELVSLPEAGIASIELTYQPTGRCDGLGNYYRYRGNVHLTSGRQVPLWDVFLATQAPETQCPAAGGAPEGAGGAAGLHGDAAPSGADTIEADGPWVGGDGEAVASSASPALDGEPTPLQVVEYYHLDALGSVRAVTDALGQVMRRHDFLPFGEELSAQIPPADRRLFTGQERDVETGLDYFHARQLRVDLGRFTAPDPMTDLAWTDGTLGATNAYGYVQSNPLGFIDPMGAADQQPAPGRAAEPWCDVNNVCHYEENVVGTAPDADLANLQLQNDLRLWLLSMMTTGMGQQQDAGKGGGAGKSGNQTQSDCIKAAVSAYVNASQQRPGTWDTFKAAQPSLLRTAGVWRLNRAPDGRTLGKSAWSLAWSYTVNYLWNSGVQVVDDMKQFGAANSQYDAAIAACKQQ